MQNVDFLPSRIRFQRRRRSNQLRYAYLVVAIAGLLFAVGFLQQERISSAEGALSSLQGRSNNLQQRLAMRMRLQQERSDLMVKKQIYDQLGSQANALDVLAELENLLPASIALTRLDMEVVEVRHTSKISSQGPRVFGASGSSKSSAERRTQILLTGLAPNDVDVANFIGQLSASPLFEEVNMGYSKTIDFRGKTAREFQA